MYAARAAATAASSWVRRPPISTRLRLPAALTIRAAAAAPGHTRTQGRLHHGELVVVGEQRRRRTPFAGWPGHRGNATGEPSPARRRPSRRTTARDCYVRLLSAQPARFGWLRS